MSDTEDLAALNDRLMAKNHALAEALSRAGKELTKAKSQLAQLAQPPLTFATMVKVDSTRTDEDGIQHASAEVISGTRRMVVPVASNVNAARLTAGATVMLNEKLVLVEQRDADTVGQIRSVKQVLDDGRLIVTDASGNPVLIRRSGALAYAGINQGDRIIVDPSVRLAIEALPAEGDKDLVLEETPDVTFADIGGLDSEIGRIRDAVQLPFQHRALFERYDLKPPKGVRLISYDDRYEAAKSSSVIVGATASPHYVLLAKDYEAPAGGAVIADLAVPRDIEPAIGNFPNVTLYDMDSLGCDALPADLRAAIERIMDEHISRFYEWHHIHECMPMIEEIRSFAEREMAAELSGLAYDSDAVREASRNMINKLLFSLKEKVDMDMAKNCYSALAKAARG